MHKEVVWYCKGCRDYSFRGYNTDIPPVCPICDVRLMKVVYDVE